MDTKRYADPAYFRLLYQIYEKKYADRPLDLLIVSDDHAFNFARKFRRQLFNNAPIVFCGVNYMDNPQSINKENITGVLELADIAGTLNALLHLYPETEKILVINDRTTTGQQYQRRLNRVLPQLDKPVSVEYTYDLTMKQILDKVSHLDDSTGVLFMTLIRDGKHQRYQLKESARMIAQASSRPVFGLVEEILKGGIVGGSISYGDDHGRIIATLANDILDGKKAKDIPIITNSPNRLIFSSPVLKRYQISTDQLPSDSTLLDAPTNIYREHKWKILIILIVLCILIILVVLQQYRVNLEVAGKQRLEVEAHIDDMTGTINRNYFEREAEAMLETCRNENKKMVFCYVDINQLKFVNDTFGHSEGDRYIIAMVGLIRSAIRSTDLIYRMGGDEFIIVFRDCDIAQANERMHAVRQELSRLNNQISTGNIKYTENYQRGISFGMAVFDPAAPKALHHLLDEADHQMYLEKKKDSSTSSSG